MLRTPKNTFILDGAHNPQAVDNFIKMWRAFPFYPRATLVCGFMRDKDYPAMARKLAAHFERVIFTQPPSPRAVPAALLKSYGQNAEIVPDWRVALRRARAQSTRVVCTGSFYLAGAVRTLVRKRTISR
jgi:dihydrofolate synthase/folylpolyglutamate synthase